VILLAAPAAFASPSRLQARKAVVWLPIAKATEASEARQPLQHHRTRRKLPTGKASENQGSVPKIKTARTKIILALKK